jgi:metal-dependent HD superfamily phosphatase/phosphodiesterase
LQFDIGFGRRLKTRRKKLQVAKSTESAPKKQEKAEKPKKEKAEKLPPDTYAPMLEARELQISDTAKLVFSVSRKGEDGLPHIDIRLHVTSEQYTGLTKKGITFNTEYLYDFMEIVNDMNKELEKLGA